MAGFGCRAKNAAYLNSKYIIINYIYNQDILWDKTRFTSSLLMT
jgi:hypothetical protein